MEKFTPGYEQKADENQAEVRYESMGCRVEGDGPEAKGMIIEADPNTNVLYTNTTIPAVSYRIRKGEKIRLETVIRTFVK